MKIDYLTLHLTGSPGSVASFVPMGLDIEMTPEGGGSWVCFHVWLIERAKALSLLMKSLGTHADTPCNGSLARTCSHGRVREKHPVILVEEKHAKLHYCTC